MIEQYLFGLVLILVALCFLAFAAYWEGSKK